MEILFIAICIAIGVGIPCYIANINQLRTARFVSKFLLVFAIVLLAASVVLIIAAEVTSDIAPEICAVCSGSGMAPDGRPCTACHGTGEATASCCISWLYPISLLALSVCTILFRFPLQEIIANLAENAPWFTSRSSADCPAETATDLPSDKICKLHKTQLVNGTFCRDCMRNLFPDETESK